MMLMSQLAIAASSIGLPRCGVSAHDGPAFASARTAANAARFGSSVNMLNLTIGPDAPACDRIIVLIGESQDRRRFCQFAAHGDELRTGRLYVAGLVPGAALQGRRTAVPSPRHAKAGECLAQDRFL